jgi:hypothetical protein
MAFSNFNFRSCLPKMNRSKMALAVSVFMVLAGAIHAQTLTDLGAAAPTPGAGDIYQLSTSGQATISQIMAPESLVKRSPRSATRLAMCLIPLPSKPAGARLQELERLKVIFCIFIPCPAAMRR